ncbi:MAG TPA: hypothetical protein VIU15_23480 [Streptomyces sp.]
MSGRLRAAPATRTPGPQRPVLRSGGPPADAPAPLPDTARGAAQASGAREEAFPLSPARHRTRAVAVGGRRPGPSAPGTPALTLTPLTRPAPGKDPR